VPPPPPGGPPPPPPGPPPLQQTQQQREQEQQKQREQEQQREQSKQKKQLQQQLLLEQQQQREQKQQQQRREQKQRNRQCQEEEQQVHDAKAQKERKRTGMLAKAAGNAAAKMESAKQGQQLQNRSLLLWLGSLQLSRLAQLQKAPGKWRREFANGYLVAEVLSHFYPSKRQGHGLNLNTYGTGNTSSAKNWERLREFCTHKTRQESLPWDQAGADAVASAAAGAAETLLDRLMAALASFPHPMGEEAAAKLQAALQALGPQGEVSPTRPEQSRSTPPNKQRALNIRSGAKDVGDEDSEYAAQVLKAEKAQSGGAPMGAAPLPKGRAPSKRRGENSGSVATDAGGQPGKRELCRQGLFLWLTSLELPPNVLQRLGKMRDNIWRTEFHNGYTIAEVLSCYFPSKRLGHGVAMQAFQKEDSAGAMQNNWMLLHKGVAKIKVLGKQKAGGDEDSGVEALMEPVKSATAGASENLLRAIWDRVNALPHPMGKEAEAELKDGIRGIVQREKEDARQEMAQKQKEVEEGRFAKVLRTKDQTGAPRRATTFGSGAARSKHPSDGVVKEAKEPKKREPKDPTLVEDKQLLQWLSGLRLSRNEKGLQQPSRWRQELGNGYVLSEILSLYFPSKTPLSHACENSTSAGAKAKNWGVLQRFCRKNRVELDEDLAERAAMVLVGEQHLPPVRCDMRAVTVHPCVQHTAWRGPLLRSGVGYGGADLVLYHICVCR
jgi:hypothetical protein